MSSAITQHELHLHLYGCLDADDVWQLGRSRWMTRQRALQWYAREYEQAWQRRPHWETYWTQDDGLAQLRRDFYFLEPGPFPRFQACFNLLIALFPLSAQDDTIIRRVLAKFAAQDRKSVELRIPFGSEFANDAQAIDAFLTMLAKTTLSYARADFQPRIAISLARNDVLLEFQYGVLRSWLARHKDLAQAITAIDFCGFEEGYPPKAKRSFFAQVRDDNERHPDTALAILYHVGESFQNMSLESAIRWVWEAHSYGAHRLGHCIALGIDPSVLLGRTHGESLEEREDHRAWLVNNGDWLGDPDPWTVSAVDGMSFLYTEHRIENLRKLQDKVMQDLKCRGAIIETCPSSNRLLGGISQPAHHPLARFIQNGLNVVIASDDPGIFQTHLAKEEAICQAIYGMTRVELMQAANIAELAVAERVARRVRKD